MNSSKIFIIIISIFSIIILIGMGNLFLKYKDYYIAENYNAYARRSLGGKKHRVKYLKK